MMKIFRSKSAQGFAAFVAIVAGAIVQSGQVKVHADPDPGTFVCFPTCSPTDGRMLAVAAQGVSSLTATDIFVTLSAPPDATSLTFGVFDGDTGGLWDNVTSTPLLFDVYLDPTGTAAGYLPANLIATYQGATMPDNAWQDQSIPTSPAAAACSGCPYRYLLRVSSVNPLASGTTYFKIRTDGTIGLRGAPFAFAAPLPSLAEAAIIYPNWPALTNTTYDGTWRFGFAIGAGGATRLTVWDGDLDWGARDCSLKDTDDPDSPAFPTDFVVSSATLAEGVAVGQACTSGGGNGSGNPSDDSSTATYRRVPTTGLGPNLLYKLVMPDGSYYLNAEPSGNSEWENFILDADPDTPFDRSKMDFKVPSLPSGVYEVFVDGVDLSNLNAFRFQYNLLGLPPSGPPAAEDAFYRIGRRVWYDTDEDGVQDADEHGIGNVTVTVYDENNNVQTGVTDASGQFFFRKPSGVYRVVVDNSNFGGPLAGLHSTTGGQTVTGVAVGPSPRPAYAEANFGYVANTPPVAGNDTGLCLCSGSTTIDVLANDTDHNNDHLTVTSVSVPAHGTATRNADGTVTYQPAAGYTGPDQFTYTVDDGVGGTSIGTVNVSTTNTAPVALDDSAVTLLNTPVTVSVLANDTDEEDGVPTIQSVLGGAPGSLIQIVSGQLVYTPPPGFSGEDVITYVVRDHCGVEVTASVRITIASPAIALIKKTNGSDNNTAPGLYVASGSTVTWTYEITNTGNVPLTNLALTDDKIGPVSCPVTSLAAGASTTCTATGTAQTGQYTNMGTVTGKPPVGPDVTAHDPDNYFGATPAIALIKKTNGSDNNTAPGLHLVEKEPVTWTYEITNTGNVPLTNLVLSDDKLGVITCPVTSLAAGATTTCSASGVAVVGQYTNMGTVTGKPPVGPDVTASDPDNYFAEARRLDVSAAPVCIADTPYVNFTIAAANFTPDLGSNATLTWKDSLGAVVQTTVIPWTNVSAPLTGQVLWPGATVDGNGNPTDWPGWLFQGGQWVPGNDGFENTRPTATVEISVNPKETVTLSYPPPTPSCNASPAKPAIALVKKTNGTNNNTAPGLYVPTGSAVTWTYDVTNTGNVPLTNLTLTDDRIGAVTCPVSSLAAGASTTCTATGTAQPGQYTNVGTVTGTAPEGEKVSATDPDNYFGATPSISLVKKTNGTNNNTAPGVYVAPGSTVTWTYDVTNTGNVALTNLTLTDDKIGPVSCPVTSLAAGASTTCMATGTAQAGQYTNMGTVTGKPPVGPDVTAHDPDNYFGAVPNVPAVASVTTCATPVTFDPLAHATYVAGPLHVTTVSTPARGTAVLNANGTITYTPNQDCSADAFTFTVAYDQNRTVLGNVTVTVSNAAPVGGADSAVISAPATSVDIAVLTNDSDPEGKPLSITAVGTPAHGVATLLPNGQIRYVPVVGYNGTDTFTYTLKDFCGATVVVQVVVTVNSCPPSTPGPFTTFTQGGWGAAPHGNNPGALLASKFASVYPLGFVQIGGGKALKFTSAAAVGAFLPAGGPAGALSASATNPTNSSAGVFAGQVLTLQLNVDFSVAGATKPGLGSQILTGGKLSGSSVSQVLALANAALGGGSLPAGVSLSDLNGIVDAINNNYDNGSCDNGYLRDGGSCVVPPPPPPPPTPGDVCYVGSSEPTISAKQQFWGNPDGSITVRTWLSRNFNDNTYGTSQIGWPNTHKFSDLVGSDKAQVALYDANGVKKMEVKIDYISASTSVASGYTTLGVTGGDGGMVLGSASDVIGARTSLAENFNTYGYVLTTNSPATNAAYATNPSYPNWIWDVWYEVTVKGSVFGAAGFGRPEITSVHASPSKTGNNTEPLVTTSCVTTPSMTLTKSVNKATANPGDQLIYTLTYKNVGTASASDVTISDVLPAHTTFVSATGGGAHAAGTVSWTLARLAAGASGSVTVTVALDPTFPNGTTTVTNAATIVSNETPVPVKSPPVSTTVTVAAQCVVILAENNAYHTDRGTAFSIGGPGLLGNDVDAAHRTLSIGTVNGAASNVGVQVTTAHGKVTVSADGSFTYTPSGSYTGTDTFTYRAKAPDGTLSNVATVTITILGSHCSGDDRYRKDDDRRHYGDGKDDDKRFDGRDRDGYDRWGYDRRGVDRSGKDRHGRSKDDPGRYNRAGYDRDGFDCDGYDRDGYDRDGYDRNDCDRDGHDRYRHDGDNDDRDDAGQLCNNPPHAVNDAYTTSKNTTLTLAAPGVLSNDSDPDGGGLTAVLQTGASHGTVTLNVNGGFTYAPAAGFVGTDSFTYKAKDPSGALSNVATATITIVSPAPHADDDRYRTPNGTTLAISAPGIIGNDDGTGAMTAQLVSSPSHGTLTLNANGSFTYKPASNFAGQDAFTYKVKDATGNWSNVATVTIDVDQCPTAHDHDYSPKKNKSHSGNVLDDCDNPHGRRLTAVKDSDVSHGRIDWNDDGTFNYTPDRNFTGTDTFTFHCVDSEGNRSKVQTVKFTVK